jgi:hypothetical protein
MKKNRKPFLISILSLASLFVLSSGASQASGEEVKRWDFNSSSSLSDFEIINENSAEYELKADGLHFGTNVGDINGKRTDVQNLFLTEVSGDYTVETHIELEKPWGYNENQACLVVFDGYGDFVKLGFQGRSVALCYAKDGVLTNDFAQTSVAASTKEIWLRIEKENDDYSSFFSKVIGGTVQSPV